MTCATNTLGGDWRPYGRAVCGVILLLAMTAIAKPAEPTSPEFTFDPQSTATNDEHSFISPNKTGTGSDRMEAPDPVLLGPLKFRRIFVPAGRVDEVTQGDERFLPVSREEFQRLVEGGQGDDWPPSAWIDRAAFRARLEGDRVLRGAAELEISHTGDAPAWLEVDTLGIALVDVQWADGRADRLGTYYGPDHSGKRGIIVRRPGTLKASWTANGRPTADGAEFLLSFPPAAATHFELSAASAVQVTADGAALISPNKTGTGSDRMEVPVPVLLGPFNSIDENESGNAAHRLDLRGGVPFRLHVTTPAERTSASASAFALRQSTSYLVTPSSTQVDAKLRITPFDLSTRQITLRCTGGASIVDVTLGGQALEYADDYDAAESDETGLKVTLRESLSSAETELRVRAIAATPLDGMAALPQVILDRSAWLGGTVDLNVDPQLSLQNLVHEGMLAKSVDISVGVEGARLVLEQVVPQATLRIHVQQSSKRLGGRALTQFDVNMDEVLANMSLDLSSETGVESIIRGKLLDGWQVISVDSQPNGLVRGWSLEKDGQSESIIVVLDRPVSPQNGVRLRLRARMPRAPGQERFPLSRLAVLQFPQLGDFQEWMQVVPASSLAVSLQGSNPVLTIHKEDISESLRELVSDRRDAYLFAADARVERTTLRVQSLAAEMTADTRLDLHIDDSTLRYHYRFSIEPRSGDVAHVGVVFSRPLAAPLQARILDLSGNELGAEITTERPPGDLTDAALPQSVRWQLAQPHSEPFELLISFEQEWDEVSPVILAAVEGAASQTGTVWTSGKRNGNWVVENLGLEPIPEAAARIDDAPDEPLSAYRYVPEGIVPASADPLLAVRRIDVRQLTPSAWIRSTTLDSAYLPSGRVMHHLTLILEGDRPEQLEMELPTSQHVLYRTSGESWRKVSRPAKGEPITIPLHDPTDPIFLEVRFSVPGKPLGIMARIEPAPLRFSAHLGSTVSRAWIPRGYRPIELSHPAHRLLAGLSFLVDNLFDGGKATVGDMGASPFGGSGWIPAPFDAEGRQIRVAHMASHRLWCAALLAGGVLAGAYLSRTRHVWTFAAAAIGFIAALLVPLEYAPFASAAAWGCAIAAISQCVRAPLGAVAARLLGTRVGKLKPALVRIAVVGSWLVLSQSAVAQPNRLERLSSPIPRVIDPIEADSTTEDLPPQGQPRPAGPHVYVPESLYSSLLKRERDRRAPVGQWLITACHIRGGIQEESDQFLADSGGWTMLLELETFQPGAEVRLPLSQGDAQWLTDTLLVDGARVTSAWRQDGKLLHIPVDQPGRHYLELKVRPYIRREADLHTLSLPLVSTAKCQFDLSVPESLVGAEFPGALGEVKFQSASSTYSGFVGHASQLVMNWPVQKSVAGQHASADVLTWLIVSRTATFIEQRFVVRTEASKPCTLDLALPSGVRWLPSAAEIPSVRIVRGEPDADRLSVVIERESDGRVTIPLQFVAEHSPTAVSVPVPRISIAGDVRLNSRSLAIQAAPGVRVTPQPGMGVEPLEPDAFIARWGPADLLPDIAYREYGEAEPWRVALAPEEVRLAVAESTIAVAHPSGISTHYRADCYVEQGFVMLHLIEMPPGFTVSHVQLQREDQITAARWVVAGDRLMRVILPDPASGNYSVLIHGEMPADEEGNVSIPLLRLDADESAAPHLATARTPGAVLSIERSDWLSPITKSPLPDAWRDEWLLHGQYSVSHSTSGAPLVKAKVVVAELPRDVQTIVALAPALPGWEASVHCTIRPAGAAIDRLVFFAPREWQGPFEVDPPDRWRLTVQEESMHRRILLSPLAPQSETVEVTLRGQMPRDRQDVLTVPGIRLISPAAQDSFVALPRETSGQATVWQTQGLERVEMTPPIEHVLGSDNRWLVYRAADAPVPATARLTTVDPSASATRVSLMDVLAVVDRGQAAYVETTFTLDPRGRRSCDIRVPAGYTILEIQVNGRHLSAWQVAADRWRAQLDSTQLPQIIQVTSQPGAAAGRGERQIASPVLLGDEKPISVVQTAWEIRSDGAWEGLGNRQRLSEVSGAAVYAARVANLVQLLDETRPRLVGSSSFTWMPWLDHWRGRIAIAEGQFTAHEAVAARDQEATSAVQHATARLVSIERELSQSAPPVAEPAPSTDSPPTVKRPLGEPGFYLLGDGQVDAIRLQLAPQPTSYAAHRILGAMLLSLIVGGIAWSHLGPPAHVAPRPASFPFIILLGVSLLVLLMGNLWAIIAAMAGVALVLGMTGREPRHNR